MPDEARVRIASDYDVVTARQRGRALAMQLGFTSTELTFIATAISELARNIYLYAGEGEIVLSETREAGRRGIMIVARDSGPGIPDPERAMQDAYSTGDGLGIGLPCARRLMDEFEIQSEVGRGTTVTVKKWRPALLP